MKEHGKTRWAVCVAGLAFCTATFAQGTNVTPEQDTEREGQEISVTVETRTQTHTDGSWEAPPTGELDREQVNQRIQDRLQQFQLKRAEYLKRMQEQQREMKGASDEQREQIRAKLRAERDGWLRLAREIRDRARTRLQEMKDALPSHQEMLEEAREKAREQVRQRVEDARDRVGVD
jgi:DNA anti-recombination protein RmuC